VKQRSRIHPHLHDVLVNVRPVIALLPGGCRLQGQANANHRPTVASIGEANSQDRLHDHMSGDNQPSASGPVTATFREVGRVIRHCPAPALPLGRSAAPAGDGCHEQGRGVQGFSQWIGFGNGGVITDNDPVEQEKTAKCNALLTNVVIFHNALDIAEIVRQFQEEGARHRPGRPRPHLAVSDRARPPLR
jgi:Tn3 transposase DDE domain